METLALKKVIRANGSKNLGLRNYRIAENIKHNYNKTEQAFIDKWRHKTTGEAKHLEILLAHVNDNKTSYLKITNRDRAVCATIIQWLGSNCGMCFLQESLNDAGFKIIEKTKI